MKKLESWVLNLLFFMHCFLVMLLVFESHVSIPYWLQPLGRMHPLILHFPIVFIVLLVLLNFLKNQIDLNSYRKINRFLILFTALTTVLASIMGLFLSLEGDTTNLMALHKWIGVAISFSMYGLVFIKNDRVFKTVLYIGFIGVIFAGHYGAGLTHGANFITEPLKRDKILVLNEETPIFKGFVKPILDAKCLSCHNSDKQKGDLDMSSFENMLKGGKNGALWAANNPKESALLKRVHLPLEHKEHMPPEGKKQLTKDEIKLLSLWIKNGADDKINLVQLPENDSLGSKISGILEKKAQKEAATYTFNFAEEKEIKALEHPFRTVIQKSPSSPAIDVVIHGRQTYTPDLLTDLQKIKKQIVSLNVSYLPIDKSSIDFISSMTNLEALILNFTDLKTDDLDGLKKCSNLQTLSLSGTQIDSNISRIIKALPKLNRVFIWNTVLNEEDIKTLKQTFSKINIETGFQDSEKKLTLTPPRLLSKSTVISKDDYVALGHKMPGIEIRYTTDDTEPNESSQLYSAPIKIDLESNLPIKAIAYKENWLPSSIKTYRFFDKGHQPEKLDLVYQGIYSEFIGEARILLTDDNIGGSKGANFNEKNPLNATADFGENPPNIKKIILSSGRWKQKNPLSQLEIWGGQHTESLTLLNQAKITYQEKSKIVIETNNTNYRYYKIIAKPHKKELFYIDQLFFY